MTKVIVNSPQHMQIIQKKENMKISFVINIYEKLNICGYIKYKHFCLLLVKMWHCIFQKTNFQNSKKLESIVNIFVFLEKLHVRAKIPPFLNNPSLFQPYPFQKKVFIPLIAKLEKSIPPLCKRGDSSYGFCIRYGFCIFFRLFQVQYTHSYVLETQQYL